MSPSQICNYIKATASPLQLATSDVCWHAFCVCILTSSGCRIPAPAPAVTYSGEHAGMRIHIVWSGRDAEHGVDLIGTGEGAAHTCGPAAWPFSSAPACQQS